VSIGQVLLLGLGAAFGGAVLLWYVRSQELASSSIVVTSRSLSRERLEALFVRHIANRGRDRRRSFDDHIASQPNHFRWTLELHFAERHDVTGEPVIVAETQLGKAYLIPFPRKYPVWQVVERWDELAPRMRALIKEINKADPEADIAVVPAMFM
jgi:hypothetical protein